MKEIISLAEQKLTDIVLDNPSTMQVFSKLGIDFCCGGKQTLAKACEKRQLVLEDVEQALVESAISASLSKAEENPRDWSLIRLANHIVDKHHAYVQEQIPEILRLLDKVSKRHGGEHPELFGIQSAFQAVADELTAHMKKEELILFPWIKRLEAVNKGEIGYTSPPFGSVANPILMMEMEHESAGGGCEKIRELSKDFTLPEGACMSYWQVYQLLDAFEKDLHLHVHLENNILFPKAIALEIALTQPA